MTQDGFFVPEPAFDAFSKTYAAGQAQILYRRVAGDLDTPVSAYLKLTKNQANSFLLESVEGGEMLGRYSMIGMAPDLIWRAHGNTAEIDLSPETENDTFRPVDAGAVESLQDLIKSSEIHLDDELQHKLPPMAAGMFGYFGYDFVRLTEHLPNRPKTVVDVPDGYFIRPTLLAIFDNVKREVILVTPVRPRDGVNAKTAYDVASDRLADAVASLSQGIDDVPNSGTTLPPEFVSNTTQSDYEDRVSAAKEYIAAGDIFQVVLSQRFSAPLETDAFSVYRQLRRINPSPFLFFLNFAPTTLLGASPEILVRVRDNKVTIRPIAGTRPRGANNAEDIALEAELLADPKERSEHLMLLDLGRNDVGRSSKIGTVKPTDTFTIERYSHVMHIVSNVEGELAEGLHPLDALANGFPAGTLTGAPKVRAMEIIDELEVDGRGPYGGCIGYFGSDGAIDTCIGLRMAVVCDGQIHIQAGAGVVADSDPTAEHNECMAKSAALKQAVSLAARTGSGN